MDGFGSCKRDSRASSLVITFSSVSRKESFPSAANCKVLTRCSSMVRARSMRMACWTASSSLSGVPARRICRVISGLSLVMKRPKTTADVLASTRPAAGHSAPPHSRVCMGGSASTLLQVCKVRSPQVGGGDPCTHPKRIR